MPADPTSTAVHLTTTQLEEGIDDVRLSPAGVGSVELIACRPERDARNVLDEARLDPTVGLVGDMWHERASTTSPDGGPHPDRQLTLMNVRFARLITGGDDDRVALAGDQLYVDFDLSVANAPAGTRLRVGDEAIVEFTAEPHTGCGKFSGRFGPDALRFANGPLGSSLRLRGANTRVVRGGAIRRGDAVTKL